MTVRRQIGEILHAVSPRSLCDDCLAAILRRNRKHVNHMSRALAETSLYERGLDHCSRCRKEKLATRSLTRGAGAKTAPILRLVN